MTDKCVLYKTFLSNIIMNIPLYTKVFNKILSIFAKIAKIIIIFIKFLYFVYIYSFLE
jgi:hypothetical protein